MKANAMTADNFPIQYPGQMPSSDLFAARSLLRALGNVLEQASGNQHGMSRQEAADMLHIFGIVSAHLDTLQRPLDDEEVPGFGTQYQRVRRAEILEQWEATR